MTEDRHQRISDLFVAAHDLEPGEREHFLDRECADDPTLRAEVEKLLAEDSADTTFLDSPALGKDFELRGSAESKAQPHGDPAARLPEGVGSFKIVEVLGQGGMGVVYLAEQAKPKRRVALKVIRPGAASDRMLRRFEHEAEVLGRLQHPGIAQVFEAGTADAGSGPQPYFAMEYVGGRPLLKYAEENGLSPAKRLELLSKVCDAVHHAHQKGVIHRDLKPGNILVDETGQPKILDFGVARAIDADIQTTTITTDVGQLIGTLQYMSPEQAAGDPDELDTRSDVYALGVIAYELLSGRLPYDVRRKMVHDAVRIIREEEPTPLSSADRTLRGDLETIVAKTLEKGTQRRYQSASELAADIQRYLHDEPILARRAGSLYQLRKFAKRHSALVTGAIAVGFALVLGIAGTVWQAVVATSQRDRAVEAEQLARQRSEQVRALATTVIFDAHDAIKELPGATEPRKLLVASALEYLDSLAEDAGGDPTLQRELAGGYERLGDVLGHPLIPNLGDTAGALSSYRKALTLREAVVGTDPRSQADLLALARAHGRLAGVQRFSGEAAAAIESYEHSTELAKAVATEAPDNWDAQQVIAANHSALAILEVRRGRTGPALELALEAVAISSKLVDADPSDTARRAALRGSYYQLGWVQEVAGQTAGALASFQRTVEIAAQLCQAEPNNTRFRRGLAIGHAMTGDMLTTMGRTNDALVHYEKNLEIAVSLAETDPKDLRAQQDLAHAYERIAFSLQERGRGPEALEYFQRGLDVRQAAVQADPENAEGTRNLMISYIQVGDALRASDAPAEGKAHYQRALERGEALLVNDPGNEATRQLLAATVERLGHAQVADGDLEGARANYKRMLEICKASAERDPASNEARADLSVAYNNVGEVQKLAGEHQDALASYRESLDIRRTVAASDRANAEAQLKVVDSHERIGQLLGELMGRPAEAVDHYLKAVEIRQALAEGDSSYVPRKSNLAQDHFQLGTLRLQIGQADQACVDFSRCLEIREALADEAPDDGSAQRRLVMTLERLAIAKMRLADQGDRAPKTRLEELQNARVLLQRASVTVANLRQRGLLTESDAELQDQLASEIPECDAAIAELEDDPSLFPSGAPTDGDSR